MPDSLADSLYVELAAAYVRGCDSSLAGSTDAETIAAGRECGLRVHRFKRTAGLPRVRRVLGALKAFRPTSLLDVGSGRGVFLWPLLDELPDTVVSSVDVLAHRVEELAAVARGGIERLRVHHMDAAELDFTGRTFDVVTVLEVLEHVPDPGAVAAELVRVGRRAVIATVPSKEDDNPEHIRLFAGDSLSELFTNAGARRVSIEYVLGHIVAVATLGDDE